MLDQVSGTCRTTVPDSTRLVPDTPTGPTQLDTQLDTARHSSTVHTHGDCQGAPDSPRQQAPTLDISVRSIKPTVARQWPDSGPTAPDSARHPDSQGSRRRRLGRLVRIRIRGQGQGWGPFSPTARSRTRKQTSHTRTSHTRTSHTRSIGKPSSLSCQAWHAHGAILLVRLLVALRHVLCQVDACSRAVEPAEDQVRVRPARPLSAAWPPSARPRGRDRAAGRRTVVGRKCLMSSAACSSIACASQPGRGYGVPYSRGWFDLSVISVDET